MFIQRRGPIQTDIATNRGRGGDHFEGRVWFHRVKMSLKPSHWLKKYNYQLLQGLVPTCEMEICHMR